MSSLLKWALVMFAAAGAAWAQPSIGGIVNGGSYSSTPSDSSSNPIGNNLVAQGAIFIIFGNQLGPAALVQSSSLPLTTSLPNASGTSVSVSAGGQTLAAYMVYASATQVAAILPSNTPVGTATVTVTYNGQTSGGKKINVVQSGLGVFTQNSQGNGPAIFQLYHGANAPGLGALTNSAQAGDTLVIYGTGLGAISGADNVAPGSVAAGANVTVNIAGQTIQTAYAGRSPNFPGLDQINFQLPSNLPSGCYIPAEVTASGQPSNLFYLSIANGSTTCTHPLGLNATALAALDAGGTVNVGLFQMLRAVELGVSAEGTGGLFDTANADATFQLFSRILVSFGGVNFPAASGSCAVLQTTVPYSAPSVPDFKLIGGKELNAGPAITVSGPTGSAGVPRLSSGGYETVFFATLGKGNWTLTGTGGPDVGAFTSNTTLPDNLVWTNAGNLSSPPRADITIVWTGGAVDSNSLVTVFGSSVVINPTDPSKNRGAEFYCNAPASAGKVIVPASIVLQLPSDSSLDKSAGEVAFGSLGINTGGGSSFSAPLTSGKLDAGYLAFGEAHSLSVTFQ